MIPHRLVPFLQHLSISSQIPQHLSSSSSSSPIASVPIASSSSSPSPSSKQPSPSVSLQLTDFPYLVPLSVRFSDCDMYEHVHNVSFYNFFDTALNHVLIRRGQMKVDREVGLMAASNCQFLESINYPQFLLIGCRVIYLGNSSVRFQSGIFDEATKKLCAVGHFTFVFCARKTMRPILIPSPIRAALESLFVEVGPEKASDSFPTHIFSPSPSTNVPTPFTPYSSFQSSKTVLLSFPTSLMPPTPFHHHVASYANYKSSPSDPSYQAPLLIVQRTFIKLLQSLRQHNVPFVLYFPKPGSTAHENPFTCFPYTYLSQIFPYTDSPATLVHSFSNAVKNRLCARDARLAFLLSRSKLLTPQTYQKIKSTFTPTAPSKLTPETFDDYIIPSEFLHLDVNFNAPINSVFELISSNNTSASSSPISLTRSRVIDISSFDTFQNLGSSQKVIFDRMAPTLYSLVDSLSNDPSFSLSDFISKNILHYDVIDWSRFDLVNANLSNPKETIMTEKQEFIKAGIDYNLDIYRPKVVTETPPTHIKLKLSPQIISTRTHFITTNAKNDKNCQILTDSIHFYDSLTSFFCLGSLWAIVCSEAFEPSSYEQLLRHLAQRNTLVIDVSLQQAQSYICSSVELRSSSGKILLGMSNSALHTLTVMQREYILRCVDEIVPFDVSSIEFKLGESLRSLILDI
jgi:acyl-CoA thioester hydrolase